MMAMSNLFERCFPQQELKSNREIIWWWEKKRILYNLIMLVFGSVTLFIGYLCGFITQIFPYPGLLLFAISANIFYTSGWLVEITARKYLSDQPFFKRIGPIIFISGTVFSVFLTFAIDVAIIISYIIPPHSK